MSLNKIDFNVMSNNHTSIHEFDFNLIVEYFSNLNRLGPGSPEMTVKALSFIEPLTPSAQIADLGCGTGGQTAVIAQNSPGNITALDIFPAFIDKLNQTARDLHLHNRMKGIIGSMDDLPFNNESLDLIWSEGAIYNIGFERGIKEWYAYLKKGGYLAITEATWFTNERPDEIEAFWQEAYPEIDTIPVKVSQIQDAGYIPVATFILPKSCWTDFYAPQPAAQEAFLQQKAGNKMAADFIAYQRHEMKLFQKYAAYYGYAFYIAKKI